jgi:hypothetical protein
LECKAYLPHDNWTPGMPVPISGSAQVGGRVIQMEAFSGRR